MIAKVYVSPRREVLDPQGQVVHSELSKLGFAVTSARVGKLIELDLGSISREEAAPMVERMCQRFLANPIVEDYRFDLVEG